MKSGRNEPKIGNLAPISNYFVRPKMSMEIPTNLTNIGLHQL